MFQLAFTFQDTIVMVNMWYWGRKLERFGSLGDVAHAWSPSILPGHFCCLVISAALSWQRISNDATRCRCWCQTVLPLPLLILVKRPVTSHVTWPLYTDPFVRWIGRSSAEYTLCCLYYILCFTRVVTVPWHFNVHVYINSDPHVRKSFFVYPTSQASGWKDLYKLFFRLTFLHTRCIHYCSDILLLLLFLKSGSVICSDK